MKYFSLLSFFFLSFSISTFSQWTLQNSGSTNVLYSVDFIDGNIGWVAGPNDIIKKTVDGGQSWELYNGQLFPIYRNWYSVDFVNENEGYVCGNEDLNWKEAWWTYTKNGGNKWIRPGSDTYVPNTSTWTKVFFLNEQLGWKVGYRNSTGRVSLTTSGVGDDWDSSIVGSDALYGVMFVDENNGWIVGSNGSIYNSEDGGLSWSPQNSGTTKSLKEVYFINAKNGWCVGHKDSQAIILKTTDGGDTWTSTNPAAITELHSIQFLDDDNGWACGSIQSGLTKKGVILNTEDGGNSWEVHHIEDNCSILYDIDFKNGVGYAVGTSGTVIKYIYGEDYLQFTSLANMKSKKYGFGYTFDGENIYTICGEKASPFSYPWISTTIDKYNIANNSWNEIASGLIPRRFCSAEYIPSLNKIYVFNGDTYSNSTYTDTVEIFDISSGELSYSASNEYPVEYGGSAVWNNKIYIFGGSNSDGFSKRLYEFDPMDNSWTRLKDMPQPKQTNGEIINGILYVFGGYNYFNSNKIDAYNIQDQSWSSLGEMPVGISAHATTKSGNTIWIVGSYENILFLANYDTKSNSFVQVYSNMIGRRHAGAVVKENKLYVFGGNQSSNVETSILNSLQYADIPDFISAVDRIKAKNVIKIVVHPNPSSTSTIFEYNLPHPQKVKLRIYNFWGTLVYEVESDQVQGKQELSWNSHSLPEGNYYYLFETDDYTSTGKIIKVK